MHFEISNGRSSFWQWDLNQKIIIEGLGQNKQVHFKSEGEKNALVVEPYREDGRAFANVPNKLLQKPGKIVVWVYSYDSGRYTQEQAVFEVKGRQKPANYVYTETEVLDYLNHDIRLDDLEKNADNLETALATLTKNVELLDVGLVRPEDFGAVGDGVTDDTKAIQAAIDYLAANRGGILFLSNKCYLTKELYFTNINRATTVFGSGRSDKCTNLLFNGETYCMNVHGCTHLFFRNFAIYSKNPNMESNNGGIRYYDKHENLTEGYTDCRTNDSIVSHVLISGFRYGVAVDSPCGYITIDDVYVEEIQSDGHAVSVGKYYNLNHLNSGRYKVNPNYIYVNKLMCNGAEFSSEKENSMKAGIGLYRCNHVHISDCDICNMKTSYGVYINDSKGFVSYVQLEQNAFYNVHKALYVELTQNDSSVTVTNIHSRNNRYFVGNWENSVPITIHGNSARTVPGFSSVGDSFEGNIKGLCKYFYDLDYVRNIRISDYTVTPDNENVVNLWDTTFYKFSNVSNIFGIKSKTFEIDATTEENGVVTLTTDFKLWDKTPYVLCNMRTTSSTQYNIMVEALTNKSVLLRVRNYDGTAIANTAIATTVTLIGT